MKPTPEEEMVTSKFEIRVRELHAEQEALPLEEARQVALGWLGEAMMHNDPYWAIERAIAVLRNAKATA